MAQNCAKSGKDASPSQDPGRCRPGASFPLCTPPCRPLPGPDRSPGGQRPMHDPICKVAGLPPLLLRPPAPCAHSLVLGRQVVEDVGDRDGREGQHEDPGGRGRTHRRHPPLALHHISRGRSAPASGGSPRSAPRPAPRSQRPLRPPAPLGAQGGRADPGGALAVLQPRGLGSDGSARPAEGRRQRPARGQVPAGHVRSAGRRRRLESGCGEARQQGAGRGPHSIHSGNPGPESGRD